MRRLKTAIIGMGKMGRIRYNALQKHGGFDIVSVCDTNLDNLTDFNCKKTEDWHECLDGIDAVIVCTYNNIIPDVVSTALNKGMNVFSEKPPGRNLADALSMKEAANISGRVLKFGFNHRYHNSVIEAKALIDSKLLGEIVCARGVYGKAGSPAFPMEWRNEIEKSGGGILLDQGIHMLDLLRWFVGDFNDVTSSVSKIAWHDIMLEDNAFAILKTRDGKIASLHSTAAQWKHKFDLDIICANGYIALNGLITATKSYGEERITYYRKDLEAVSGKIGNPIAHTMIFETDNSWDYEIAEFYGAVAEGEAVKNGTPDDAVSVMRLVESIYSGGAVYA